MIVASLLLVIVAAVTLVIGLFNQDSLQWVWTSIGFCVAAGLLLIIGVMRARPRRKPVLQSGGEQPASWSGASSWGGATEGSESALQRDDAAGDVRVLSEPAPEPAQDLPTPSPVAETDRTQPLTAPADESHAAWEPQARTAQPETAEPTMAPDAGAQAADEPAVIPKASARKQTAAAAGGGDTSDAQRIEAALKDIAGVGPAKRQAIAARFDTYRKLRMASVEKLAEVPGVSRTLAERIHAALRR